MSKVSHREILAEGTVIGSKWKIGKLVGEGACGRVYAVTDVKVTSCSFPLVAKLIPTPTGKGKVAKEQGILCDTLYYEYNLFHGRLCDFPYRPNVPDIRSFHGVDDVHGYRFLVMERFERDLVSYSTAVKPDNKAVAEIGLQILDGLEWMHNKGLLFIDVKPDNFMLKGDKVKFVDYGLVEPWATASGSREQVTRVMAGTPSYASLDVHNCLTPMRKDDIESMGLVLISLFTNGELPWFDSRSDEECKTRKRDCNIMELSLNNDCSEVGEIVMKCRDLKFSQKPNYAAYKELLILMRDRKSTHVNRVRAIKSISLDKSKLPTSSSSASSSTLSTSTFSSSSASSDKFHEPRSFSLNSSNSSPDVEIIIETGVNDENKNNSTSSNGRLKRGGYSSKSSDIKVVQRVFDSHCKINEHDKAETLDPKILNTRPVKVEPSTRKSPRLIQSNQKKAAHLLNVEEEVENEVEFLNRKKTSTGKERNFKFIITSERQVGTTFSFDYSQEEIVDDDGYHQRTFGNSNGTEAADHLIGKDPLISDSHLAVMWRYTAEGEPEIEILDKKSTGGSWLNNKKLGNKWQKASNGDEIKIGDTSMRILIDSSR